MTEYWVSTGKKWCNYCKIFVVNTKICLTQHETSQRHKENVRKYLDEQRKLKLQKSKEEKELQAELKRIEEEAQKAYLADLRASGQYIAEPVPATKPKRPHGQSEYKKTQEQYLANQMQHYGYITGPDTYGYYPYGTSTAEATTVTQEELKKEEEKPAIDPATGLPMWTRVAVRRLEEEEEEKKGKEGDKEKDELGKKRTRGGDESDNEEEKGGKTEGASTTALKQEDATTTETPKKIIAPADPTVQVKRLDTTALNAKKATTSTAAAGPKRIGFAIKLNTDSAAKIAAASASATTTTGTSTGGDSGTTAASRGGTTSSAANRLKLALEEEKAKKDEDADEPLFRKRNLGGDAKKKPRFM